MYNIVQAPQNKSSQSKKSSPKVALVLGAGGVRGFSHIGVLEVLHEAGIPIDRIVGCSIGAVIGALYAQGSDYKHIYDFALRIVPKGYSYRVYGLPSLKSAIKGKGLFTMKKFLQLVEKELQAKSFEELQTPLTVVATNIMSGHLTEFDSGPLLQAVGASCTIPGLFQPVEIEGEQYIDGGMLTELPVTSAQRLKAKVILASSLREGANVYPKESKYSAAMRTYHIMRHLLDKHEMDKVDIMLRPVFSDIPHLLTADKKSARLFYERGKKTAEKHLPHIRKMIANA